ncbi:hypothetical protein SEMRO_441_G143670.1 [Seminavis robusta]|uniref:Uncharacterized protein n=1 Tax=Seminavis robusta TaxID=568900 RepID=A0A9N8DXH4_9STRA|nr:hypothetical protein SEMRO_441_G143670.1 [Seminavis robusta]|eukprot:Sro441_g143670.1 n/a (152) ;mRNA; f:31933-32388
MEMAAFEKEVLRLIESKDKKVGRETSKRLTPDKLNRRIHALKFWKEGDGTLNKKEFKREYSDCRSLASQGYLVKNHPSTGESLLYKVDPKSHKETRFVDMLETFDIIEMIHLRGCHLKHETNHISILELGFGNITRAECEAYVKKEEAQKI